MITIDHNKQSMDSGPTIIRDVGHDRSMKIAFVLFVIAALPIIPNFGLIFDNALLNIELKSISSIICLITVNLTVSMIFHIIAGPLIMIIGYRSVAILSSCFLTLGIIGSAMLIGNEFPFVMLMLWYGVVTPIGIGLGGTVFPLSLMTYFKERRIKIYSLSMIIGTVGYICYPAFVATIIFYYNSQDCLLIVGAIALNTIIGAFLIQSKRIANHCKYVEKICLNEKTTEQQQPDDAAAAALPYLNSRRKSLPRTRKFSIDETSRFDFLPDGENYENFITQKISVQTMTSTPKQSLDSNVIPQIVIKEPIISMETSFGIFGDMPIYVKSHSAKTNYNQVSPKNLSDKEYRKIAKYKWTSFPSLTIKSINTSHLRDKILMNTLIGMSIATVTEMLYIYLQPFIVFELLNCSVIEMAIFLIGQYFVELIWRVLAHYYLSNYLIEESSKIMCVVSWTMGIMAKTFIIMITHYNKLLVVTILLGVTRGLRQVYMHRVLTESVPNDQLSAVGVLQMTLNAIGFILFGSILGIVGHFTNNYTWCVIFLNILTALPIAMWTFEFFYLRYKRKKERNNEVTILNQSDSNSSNEV